MTTYNIIYDKTINFTELHDALVDAGVTINKTFQNIGVINLDADNLDFTSISGVLQHEEDTKITPELQSEWHQQRVVKRQLPLSNTYYPDNHGDNVVVYLVDTAVETTHSEFNDVTVTNLWSHDDDFTPHSHGTAVASLIAGKNIGISNKVHLKSVVIPSGETSISVLIEAFDVIIQDHDETKVGVVNCSWIISKSQILDIKINELQNDNLVVVAAAGNLGQDANNYSPVGLNSVLGVGACDAFDRVISWGSGSIMNYGEEVDITAPGIDVVHASLNDSMGEGSGTSFACGVVSGVVAQVIVSNPTQTAAQVQATLINQSSADLLFRNETIYGDTPNLIVYSTGVRNLITNCQDVGYTREDKILVQKGSSYTRAFTLKEPAVSISITSISVGGSNMGSPEWITLEGNNVIISPTEDVTTHNYVQNVVALDSEGEVVGYCRILFGVYENESSELDDQEAEYYDFFETGDLSQDVTVLLSACSAQSCDSSGWCSTKGGGGCCCHTSFLTCGFHGQDCLF